MEFSDSSTMLGLVQDTLFRTNTNVNEFPLKDITRYINEGYSRVANTILQADGRMQWDDNNHTDQPIAYSSLVASQQDYNVFGAAPTALQDWLMVDRVTIKDSNGDWKDLTPIDRKDIPTSPDEWMETAGAPSQYDFNGSQVLLYPAPDYASTGGIKIYFNRAPSYFVSTDTTKRPGFATIFHDYLSLYATHQWNITKKNDFSLQPILDKKELEIGKFYSKRNKVETPRLSRAYENFK